MRKYKFRGMFCGEFIYGYYTHDKHLDLHTINNGTGAGFTVDRSTIGQYVDLKDRNGTEIYEGDILKIQRVTLGEEFEIERVVYDKYEGMYLAGIYRLGRIDHRAEVIGNIYENENLLDQIGRAYEGI